jgi:hypothetical protein
MSYNPAENGILLTTRVPAHPDSSIYDLYTIPKDAGESSVPSPDGRRHTSRARAHARQRRPRLV